MKLAGTIDPVLNSHRVVALIALLAVAGCAGANSGPTTANIANIDVGMTESQVLSIAGQPRMRETYGSTSFLIYVDDRGANVPVALVDGRVTSMGRAAYDIVVRSQAQTTGSVHR
jgi:outer membrane protein assembly factor BamE (lipoprotein component of BamABCDE complex)